MAICRTGNTVNFGTFSLTVTPTGLYTDGRLDFVGCSLTPTQAQGSVSGYTSGGYRFPVRDTISKFPFTSDTGTTDVGELTQARQGVAGQSSSVSGYSTSSSIIDKFPFSSDTSATCIGQLSCARFCAAGQSSTENGYTSGGQIPPHTDVIDKFPFTSDTNATDVGNLTQSRLGNAGQSSRESGYTSGGGTTSGGSPGLNTIDKFPFASDTNATDVGDLSQTREAGAGQSSIESGYMSGGGIFPSIGEVNTIDKFPFAADAPATDVGNLTRLVLGAAGQSSLVSGYTAGGDPVNVSTIEKFPFAADANATDVGEHAAPTRFLAGHQV